MVETENLVLLSIFAIIDLVMLLLHAVVGEMEGMSLLNFLDLYAHGYAREVLILCIGFSDYRPLSLVCVLHARGVQQPQHCFAVITTIEYGLCKSHTHTHEPQKV